MINENCMKCVENRFTNLTEMQTIASLEIASLLLSFFWYPKIYVTIFSLILIRKSNWNKIGLLFSVN